MTFLKGARVRHGLAIHSEGVKELLRLWRPGGFSRWGKLFGRRFVSIACRLNHLLTLKAMSAQLRARFRGAGLAGVPPGLWTDLVTNWAVFPRARRLGFLSTG